MARIVQATVVASFLALPLASPTLAQVYYTLNGVPVDAVTQSQLYAMGIPPGAYWMDAYGNIGPMGAGPIPTPNGYVEDGTQHYQSGGEVTGGWGQVNPDGSWSYSNHDPYGNRGASVVGDSNGCWYYEQWSNC